LLKVVGLSFVQQFVFSLDLPQSRAKKVRIVSVSYSREECKPVVWTRMKYINIKPEISGNNKVPTGPTWRWAIL
jgi:hypothetical protein